MSGIEYRDSRRPDIPMLTAHHITEGRHAARRRWRRAGPVMRRLLSDRLTQAHPKLFRGSPGGSRR